MTFNRRYFLDTAYGDVLRIRGVVEEATRLTDPLKCLTCRICSSLVLQLYNYDVPSRAGVPATL